MKDSHMMKLGSVFIALVLAASPASADPKAVRQAKDLLYNWQPKSVSKDGSTLRVVLNEREVTQAIYLAIIQSGICVGILTGKPLHGISSIEVLNQFAKQGYVYEAGTEDCARINALPITNKIRTSLVLGKTHGFWASRE